MRTRLTVLISILLSFVLMAAACGDDDEAIVEPPITEPPAEEPAEEPTDTEDRKSVV